MSGVHAAGYASTYFRNCPGLRPTAEEREELVRLFHVAMSASRTAGHLDQLSNKTDQGDG